jgi:TatD DNase family protein
LDFERFDADRDQVVSRARQSGVRRILNPGINLASSQAAIQLSEDHNEVFAAVGVHPNDGLSWGNGTISRLRDFASHSKVVAIGEIGLDYYRDYTPRDLQKQIFKEQLRLAAELNLPVIIHCREAFEDIIFILRDWQQFLSDSGSDLRHQPGVLHSWSGDEHFASRVINLQFCIGITGPVTFRNAQDLQDLVIRLPIQHLLIETDSPFLTPHPRRGKRNEPANVKLVAEKIAELHQESYNRITDITSTNATRLFQW